MTLSLAAGGADFDALETPLLVLALASGATLTTDLSIVDEQTGKALGRLLERRDFRGGRDETLHLAASESGIQRVVLVGMGKVADRAVAIRRAAMIGARQAVRLGTRRMAFYAGSLTLEEAEAAAVGLSIGGWDFREMKSAPP